jgi:tRNA nucleotidyltransferase (CCA-adding enzyme)
MIVICSHISCDLDAFSSMIAARLLFPEAKISLCGATEESVKQIINEFPEKFDIIKEKSIPLDQLKSVILVDNSNFDRAGKVGAYLKANPGLPVICFDHHFQTKHPERFVFYKNEAYGACTTVMVKEMIERGITPDPLTAGFLALGIYADTGSLLSVNTCADDLSALAFLLNVGASLSFVKKYLQPQFTTEEIVIMNQLVSSKEEFEIKGVKIHYFKIELEKELFNISQLLQYIRRSENILCFFCFIILPGKTLIIARSDYAFIQVNGILAEFGGGGHPSSGSASILGLSSELIQKRVFQLIQESIIKNGTVADIMSRHLECAEVETSIYEVGKKLSNYHFGAIPILKQGKVVGIVTKKDVGQAILHHYGSKSVDYIMSTDLIAISPDTSVYKAQEILINKNIGRLPVIVQGENGNEKLVGIVSRRDILKSNYEQHIALSQNVFENVSGYLRKLNPQIVQVIEKISMFADSLEVDAWLVGGFVRDLLMNRESMDIDIVIEGDAIEFASSLAERFQLSYASFPQFRTAIVVFKTGHRIYNKEMQIKIDFASARSEIYEKPGILPSVEMSSLKNDLYRRDFTINSMAIQINGSHYGKLFDFFNGRRDIQIGIIKILNNMSFSDDPTRILRAIRFEQRYQFKIDQKTKHLLLSALHLNLLKKIAVERIRQELVKACDDEHVFRFFERLGELGILNHLNVNLEISQEKINQMQKVSKLILWYHESFRYKPLKKWIVYICILCQDMSLRSALKFFEQYKFPTVIKAIYRDFYDRACSSSFQLSRKDLPNNLHAFQQSEKENDKSLSYLTKQASELSRGEFAWSLKNVSHEALIALLAVINEEDTIGKLKNYLLYDAEEKTVLNGDDLIELGIAEGKLVGIILKDLYIQKLNHHLLKREDEIELVKSKYLK